MVRGREVGRCEGVRVLVVRAEHCLLPHGLPVEEAGLHAVEQRS